MTNRKAKLAAGATVAGLAGLGAVALGTNHGMPAAAPQAGPGGAAAVVTSASGAPAASSGQAVAPESVQPPIVTRASGGALPIEDE